MRLRGLSVLFCFSGFLIPMAAPAAPRKPAAPTHPGPATKPKPAQPKPPDPRRLDVVLKLNAGVPA